MGQPRPSLHNFFAPYIRHRHDVSGRGNVTTAAAGHTSARPSVISVTLYSRTRSGGARLLSGHRYEVTAIGWVESPLIYPADAPKQGDEGAPAAWLAFEQDVIEGLDGLAVGDEIIVITWLHHARRDVLKTYSRGDIHGPHVGVFGLRSPDRPNPIGLHPVQILALSGNRIHVSNLEAYDGTPILDVKPVLGPIETR